MSEFRELSKLPADQAYWDQLEASITAELAPAVRGLPMSRADWWAPLATRAFALGGLAAAAVIAAILLVPSPGNGAGLPDGVAPISRRSRADRLRVGS